MAKKVIWTTATTAIGIERGLHQVSVDHGDGATVDFEMDDGNGFKAMTDGSKVTGDYLVYLSPENQYRATIPTNGSLVTTLVEGGNT